MENFEHKPFHNLRDQKHNFRRLNPTIQGCQTSMKTRISEAVTKNNFDTPQTYVLSDLTQEEPQTSNREPPIMSIEGWQ